MPWSKNIENKKAPPNIKTPILISTFLVSSAVYRPKSQNPKLVDIYFHLTSNSYPQTCHNCPLIPIRLIIYSGSCILYHSSGSRQCYWSLMALIVRGICIFWGLYTRWNWWAEFNGTLFWTLISNLSMCPIQLDIIIFIICLFHFLMTSCDDVASTINLGYWSSYYPN